MYETAFEMNGTYSSFGVSDALADFVANKSGTKPWFAVGAFQVVHEPLEVPPQFEALYPNISNRYIQPPQHSWLVVGSGQSHVQIIHCPLLTVIVVLQGGPDLRGDDVGAGRGGWGGHGSIKTL